jgi:AcrR family transcriptional regulator
MDSEKMLAESLEMLLQKKNLDDIQVSEIVAGTSLSRKTFYRHFKDKYDLANWNFTQYFNATISRSNADLSWEEGLLRFLEVCQDKAVSLKNAYSSRDVNCLRSHDIAMTRKFYEEYLTKRGADIHSEVMRFAIEIAVRGGTDMVIGWLLNGMKMEKEELMRLIKRTLPNDILKYMG